MAAYVLGQTLGPIGLFRAPVIWLLLIAAGRLDFSHARRDLSCRV